MNRGTTTTADGSVLGGVTEEGYLSVGLPRYVGGTELPEDMKYTKDYSGLTLKERMELEEGKL